MFTYFSLIFFIISDASFLAALGMLLYFFQDNIIITVSDYKQFIPFRFQIFVFSTLTGTSAYYKYSII